MCPLARSHCAACGAVGEVQAEQEQQPGAEAVKPRRVEALDPDGIRAWVEHGGDFQGVHPLRLVDEAARTSADHDTVDEQLVATEELGLG